MHLAVGNRLLAAGELLDSGSPAAYPARPAAPPTWRPRPSGRQAPARLLTAVAAAPRGRSRGPPSSAPRPAYRRPPECAGPPGLRRPAGCCPAAGARRSRRRGRARARARSEQSPPRLLMSVAARRRTRNQEYPDRAVRARPRRRGSSARTGSVGRSWGANRRRAPPEWPPPIGDSAGDRETVTLHRKSYPKPANLSVPGVSSRGRGQAPRPPCRRRIRGGRGAPPPAPGPAGPGGRGRRSDGAARHGRERARRPRRPRHRRHWPDRCPGVAGRVRSAAAHGRTPGAGRQAGGRGRYRRPGRLGRRSSSAADSSRRAPSGPAGASSARERGRRASSRNARHSARRPLPSRSVAACRPQRDARSELCSSSRRSSTRRRSPLSDDLDRRAGADAADAGDRLIRSGSRLLGGGGGADLSAASARGGVSASLGSHRRPPRPSAPAPPRRASPPGSPPGPWR